MHTHFLCTRTFPHRWRAVGSCERVEGVAALHGSTSDVVVIEQAALQTRLTEAQRAKTSALYCC